MRKAMIISGIVFLLLTACSGPPEQSGWEEHTAQAESLEQKCASEVQEYSFTDGMGNLLIFYLCTSSCDIQPPAETAGLDMYAVSAVFDPTSAVLVEEFTVEGHPAAIYQAGDICYACWTSSPEATGVLRYNPEAVSANDILRIVESVYAPYDG